MKRKLSAARRKELVLLKKQRVFEGLKEYARQGITACYQDAIAPQFPSRRWYGRHLGEFCIRCVEESLPMLPLLVVTKESKDKDGIGMPSYGFIDFAVVHQAMRDAGYDPTSEASQDAWIAMERQRCFGFFNKEGK